MRVWKQRFDTMCRDPSAALGIADYQAGTWREIKNEDAATLYEIGRLIGAEMKRGLRITKNSINIEYVEIDEFDLYIGSDYHARIGHHIEPDRRPSEEAF